MDKKEAYKAKSKEAIDKTFEKIEALEKKKDEVQSESKEAIKKEIDNLKNQKEQLEEKLDELSHSSEEAWGVLEDTIDEGIKTFENGFKKMADKF